MLPRTAAVAVSMLICLAVLLASSSLWSFSVFFRAACSRKRKLICYGIQWNLKPFENAFYWTLPRWMGYISALKSKPCSCCALLKFSTNYNFSAQLGEVWLWVYPEWAQLDWSFMVIVSLRYVCDILHCIRAQYGKLEKTEKHSLLLAIKTLPF